MRFLLVCYQRQSPKRWPPCNSLVSFAVSSPIAAAFDICFQRVPSVVRKYPRQPLTHGLIRLEKHGSRDHPDETYCIYRMTLAYLITFFNRTITTSVIKTIRYEYKTSHSYQQSRDLLGLTIRIGKLIKNVYFDENVSSYIIVFACVSKAQMLITLEYGT